MHVNGTADLVSITRQLSLKQRHAKNLFGRERKMNYLLSCALVLFFTAPFVSAQHQHAPKSSQQEATYSCPMHPAVKSKKPGKCPKCGMKLVKAKSATRAVATDTPARGGARMFIPDVELLDQDGRKVHFYNDLVKKKTVVINFIFTTCTTICPPLGATFARIQKDLGDRTGRDVHFISISVDPATDTPERLKAWAAKFNAGPGWSLVTGEKPVVDALLAALSASTARPEDHTPTIIIGNDAKGQWTRTYGLSKPSQIIQIIENAAKGTLESGEKEPE
jgi:protein SCO1/2